MPERIPYHCTCSDVRGVRDVRDMRVQCVLHTISGCGRRDTHIDWSMVIPDKAAPVTGTTLRTTGLVSVFSAVNAIGT